MITFRLHWTGLVMLVMFWFLMTVLAILFWQPKSRNEYLMQAYIEADRDAQLKQVVLRDLESCYDQQVQIVAVAENRMHMALGLLKDCSDRYESCLIGFDNGSKWIHK